MITPSPLKLKRTYSFFEILAWAAEQKRKGKSLPVDLEQLLEKNRVLLELSDSQLKFRLHFHPALQYKKEWREKLHFISHIKDINPVILYYTFAAELEDTGEGREVQLNLEQLGQLKYSLESLYYFHGNIGITGAPLFLGGIPPIIFFQWGNLLGVIKYAVLAAEKALVGNLLLYTECREEEEVEDAVIHYLHKKIELTLSPAELLQHCTRAEPEQLPLVLQQYMAAIQMQTLQQEVPIPSTWPPRPSLQYSFYVDPDEAKG